MGKKVISEYVPCAVSTNVLNFNEHLSYYLLSLPYQKTLGAAGLRPTLEIGTSLIKDLGTGTKGAVVISPFWDNTHMGL